MQWLSKTDRDWMADIYKTSLEITEATGEVYQVDHIVPLCGKTVSGLHVPWNLQIIPASENAEKRDKFAGVDS